MKLKDKKILITGSSGFIGSNLKSKLIDLGANVTSYDLENGDNILDTKNLTKFIKRNYDAVYHLAGFSGSKESNENIKKTFEVNSFSSVELMKLILKYSPKTKFIYSSSRLEYGTPTKLPINENHTTIPISSYGLSKLTTTEMAVVLAKSSHLNFTSFRTSNVYGPHKNKKFKGYNLINFFIDLAKKDEELVIFGKGTQLRDYIYVDDMSNAFILALSPKANRQIYNVGYGKGIMLKDMAKIIIKAVKKGKIKFEKWPEEYKKVETGSYVSDISKIGNELGFSPQVNFEEGINKTI